MISVVQFNDNARVVFRKTNIQSLKTNSVLHQRGGGTYSYFQPALFEAKNLLLYKLSIIAQSIIVFPIIAALSRQTIADLHEEYDEHLRSLDCTPLQSVATLLRDGRYRLLTGVMAGFGRAIAEVGAVLIVGGNIQHSTRVMTTTIALQTSKGNLALALGLGFIIVILALGVNGTAMVISDAAQKRYG